MNKKVPFLIFSFLLVSCGNANPVGAATETVLYFAPTDSFKDGSTSIKANINRKGDGDDWKTYEMVKTENTFEGRTIYKVEFTDLYDGLGKLQFQAYNGDTWLRQVMPIDSWTSQENYNGKLFPSSENGTVFTEYAVDKEIAKDSVFYLDTKKWDVDNVNERYAAFFYDGLGSTWVDLEQENNYVYKVVAPEGYTTMIFCRMDGNKIDNDWSNKWCQTENIYSGKISNNIFVINEFEGAGAWKKYTSISDIFGVADNNYTRTTTINFTSDGYNEAVSVNKYKDGFSQTRTTTWIDGALYMTNGDQVNSGYFTSKEDGSMHHFKFGGEAYNVASADNEVIDDGYAAAAGVNEFFANNDNNACSMHYLNQNKDAIKDKFIFDTNKASSDTVSYYTNDADILNRFLAICAPCYLNTPVEQGKDSFIKVTTATNIGTQPSKEIIVEMV